MSKIIGQSIIIENVSGAGGTVGSARVAAAAPDGYTLLAAAMGSHVAAPVLTPNLKYDPVADFVPIGFTAHSPAVVIARKDFPAKDLKEFVAALRQRGDGVKQAHGGIGASSHMACLLFTAEIGAKPALVAYRGSGPALNDLVGGHVDFMCEQSVSVAESVLAGRSRPSRSLPRNASKRCLNVPTASEAGINYEMSVWAGLFAPKGISPEIIARLSDALDRALNEDVVREQIVQLGGSIPPKDERNPAIFDRFVRSEIARWSPILAAAGTGEMKRSDAGAKAVCATRSRLGAVTSPRDSRPPPSLRKAPGLCRARRRQSPAVHGCPAIVVTPFPSLS